MGLFKTIGVAAILATSTQAQVNAQDQTQDPAKDGGWALHIAQTGGVLTYAEGKAVTYRFECAAGDILATQTGVTKLMDFSTGQTVGDGQQADLPAGAAMMALSAGKGDPRFQSAEAVRNPSGGWDLTIRLPANDRQVEAVGKSRMMSLFTTGYTMAVAMDDTSRARWSQFLKLCREAA